MAEEGASPFKRHRVFVETGQRNFKGDLYQPTQSGERLSDYINTYDREFLCLTNVEIADRGMEYRVLMRADFVALSVNSITFIMPLEEG